MNDASVMSSIEQTLVLMHLTGCTCTVITSPPSSDPRRSLKKQVCYLKVNLQRLLSLRVAVAMVIHRVSLSELRSRKWLATMCMLSRAAFCRRLHSWPFLSICSQASGLDTPVVGLYGFIRYIFGY